MFTVHVLLIIHVHVHTSHLCISSSNELVEDVKAPLTITLTHHTRLGGGGERKEEEEEVVEVLTIRKPSVSHFLQQKV